MEDELRKRPKACRSASEVVHARAEAKAVKEPKRLDLQLGRGLAENMADLPTRCDVGTKDNAKEYKKSWIGYKMHIDSIDGDIPVSAILSSASLREV